MFEWSSWVTLALQIWGRQRSGHGWSDLHSCWSRGNGGPFSGHTWSVQCAVLLPSTASLTTADLPHFLQWWALGALYPWHSTHHCRHSSHSSLLPCRRGMVWQVCLLQVVIGYSSWPCWPVVPGWESSQEEGSQDRPPLQRENGTLLGLAK